VEEDGARLREPRVVEVLGNPTLAIDTRADFSEEKTEACLSVEGAETRD